MKSFPFYRAAGTHRELGRAHGSQAREQTILRDRHGDPNGICRIAQTDSPQADWMTAGMTVASIIAEPDKRCLHVACGNQAESPFEVYSMN